MKDYIAYKRELKKHIENVEKDKGDYISFVLNANFEGKQHIMLVEKKVDLKDVYKELSDLEYVDLIDYLYMEKNGRTNKKR